MKIWAIIGLLCLHSFYVIERAAERRQWHAAYTAACKNIQAQEAFIRAIKDMRLTRTEVEYVQLLALTPEQLMSTLP